MNKFIVTLGTQVPASAEDLEDLRKYLVGLLEIEEESGWEDAPMHIESYEVEVTVATADGLPDR